MRRLLPLAALLTACSSDKPSELGASAKAVASSSAPSITSRSSSASPSSSASRPSGVPLPAHLFLGATASHACFVTERKNLFCWGRNDAGQVGISSRAPSEPVPQQVRLAGSVRTAALGEKHTCALLEDGSVHCFGSDASGARRAVEPLPDLPDVRSLVAGGDFTCALSGDSSVRCWGRTPGKKTPARIPELVVGLTATQLAATTNTLCAIDPTGTARCLGENAGGKIFIDGPSSFDTPTPIPYAKGAKEIGVSDLGLCALDGETAHCWGDKANEPSVSIWGVDDLTTSVDGLVCTRRNTDVLCERLPFGAWVRWESQGAYRELGVGRGFGCGLPKTEHEVVSCWGENDWGQLAVAAPKAHLDATELYALKGATRIASGSSSVCGLMPDKKIRCLGENGKSAKEWSMNNSSTEIPLGDDAARTITRADDMSVGGGIRCAFTDGLPTCWGDNTSNQIITVNPGIIDQPASFASLGKLKRLVFGPSHACSIGEDGVVKCWGGRGKERRDPVAIGGLEKAFDIAVGGDRGCALLGDGTVSCFALRGDHAFAPHKIVGAKGFTSLVAGGRHQCGVTASHELSCFGSNDVGQLGRPLDGKDGERAETVEKLAHVKQVSLGDAFTCALLDDGTVRCFGSASEGELGRADKNPVVEPVEIGGMRDVVQIAASSHAGTARLANGTVVAWGGRTFFAQVGDEIARSDAARPVVTQGLVEESP